VTAKSHWREGARLWHGGWARFKTRWWLVLVIAQLGAALVLMENGWDDRVLRAIRQPENQNLNQAAEQLYRWGDWTWSVPLALLLWGAGACFNRKRWRQLGWVCLWSFLAASVAVNLFRTTLGRPRPRTGIADGFYGLHVRSNDYHSFPSGHAASALATASSVLAGSPLLSVPCATYAVAVSWSRMQRNDHRPLDVLTGAVLGTFVGLCFGSALPGGRWRLRRQPRPLLEEEKETGASALKIFLLGLIFFSAASNTRAATNVVTVSLTPQPVNTFSPFTSLGAGVDAIPTNTQAQIYSASNRAQMLAAGFGPVSYRLNTELGVQDWHWNPNGTWSDTNGGGRGYFTGSASTNAALIYESLPFNLPHRGFTTDQQGSETVYSMLTDGDATTYWKSNPYLTSTFTGEADALHPQWVMFSFIAGININAVRVTWAQPCATSYQVQCWIPDETGGDPVYQPTNGVWQTFPNGNITNNPGGNVTNVLQATTTNVQFIRLVMSAGSGTYDTHGTNDVRNKLGFAIAELYAGYYNPVNGKFADLTRHSADATAQTVTYVSSVDPWHSATNAAATVRQPGLDFFFTNGLTRSLPAMIPVPLLYSTPANAVAEISYLKQRGYPISYVELGEEPDGQFCSPEDYGALFVQWATALHTLDPALKLGGPAFTGSTNRIVTWPDANGETSWLKRFVSYLSARGKLGELNFFSFEHYPFSSCDSGTAVLSREASIVKNSLAAFRADGVPTNVPIFCTEFNFSADYSYNQQSLVGALWEADFVGSFFAAGGAAAWFYQYEPLPLVLAKTCNTYGTFGLFTTDASFQVVTQTAQFHATQLIASQWAQTNASPHFIFGAHSDLLDVDTNETITAYATLRPDGQWALLLINKDNAFAHPVKIQFSNTVSGAVMPLFGPADFYVFNLLQYVWHTSTTDGYPAPDSPPAYALVTNAPGPVFTLPKGSLCLVRGAGPVLPGLNARFALTNDLLAFNYVRSTAKTGLTYAAQISTNLTNWVGGTQFVSETVLATNTTSQWVQARDLVARTNAPRNFLRLKISAP
jgi:membrane-associated phospholipid phosphatase